MQVTLNFTIKKISNGFIVSGPLGANGSYEEKYETNKEAAVATAQTAFEAKLSELDETKS